jgi:hypothetical protein
MTNRPAALAGPAANDFDPNAPPYSQPARILNPYNWGIMRSKMMIGEQRFLFCLGREHSGTSQIKLASDDLKRQTLRRNRKGMWNRLAYYYYQYTGLMVISSIQSK